MDAQTELLKQHSEYIFERIEGTVDGLIEVEATWRPFQGARAGREATQTSC